MKPRPKNVSSDVMVSQIRKGWILCCSVLITSLVLSGCPKISVKPQAQTFTIAFSIDTSTLYGTIEAKSGSTILKNNAAVSLGTKVVFTAKPKDGYKVKSWTVDGTPVKSNAANGNTETYSHTITKNIKVQVHFENANSTHQPPSTPENHSPPSQISKYKITLTKTEGGNVAETPAIPTDNMVEKGSEITFTANPLPGYNFEKWELNGKVLTGVMHTYKLKVTEDSVIKVFFKPNGTTITKYKVSVSPEANGTISSNPDIPADRMIAENTEIVFSAAPSTDYAVEKWAITPPEALMKGGKDGDGTATVKVTAETSVKVSFKYTKASYTVEHWLQNVEGSSYEKQAADNETKLGLIGKETDAKAKSYPGFSAKPVTQKVIAGNGSTVVKIEYDRNRIALNLDLRGGVITPALSENKLEGHYDTMIPTVAAPKKTGYKFTGWEPPLPHRFPDKDGKHTAKWEAVYHTVTFSIDGEEQGSLKATVDGNDIRSNDPVQEGKTVVFTAEPNPDFKINGWSSGAEPISGIEHTYKLKITGPVEVKVRFAPLYTKVEYDKLEEYLKTISDKEENYIEITGNIPKDDFVGSSNYGIAAGRLGKIIQSAGNEKKIALKLPETVPGLTDMNYCFARCKNLISVKNIPINVQHMNQCFDNCTGLAQAPKIPESVTNMIACFSDCSALTQAPDIPSNVTDMSYVFSACLKLTRAPAIPENVTTMNGTFSNCLNLIEAPDIPAKVTNLQYCFENCISLKKVKLNCDYNPNIIASVSAFYLLFKGCSALEDGSIQVKESYYAKYTADAALDIMTVPPEKKLEMQKAKFSKF